VAFFDLCYVFYIVFVQRIKWCIMPHIIVQMDLPVNGYEQSAVEANLPNYHFEESMFVISPTG
jgi:hypothetical protein